jgi:hypothetical protein
MKALFCAMALSLALVGLSGCESLTETPGEHNTRIAHTVSTNWREITPDLDRALLFDHPSWMAREPIPNE